MRALEDSDNVKVAVRCRPMSKKEILMNNKSVTTINEVDGCVTLQRTDSADDPPKQFTFDVVFGCSSKQTDIYNRVARPIVDKVLEGYNGTILAYGQTGTGKTFTMEGIRSVPELRGIIPNSFAHIFGAIAKADTNVRFLVRVSYLEIYNEEGSERQAKTGATGKRLQEANKINLSLATLGNVISALVDGKSTHVPYRNSKLTRLLQDSLGGNSKTAMIANISPSDYNYDESLSTLRYANRAKNIKNKAKINEDPKDAMLRQFQKEIEQLRRQLEEGGIPSDPANIDDEVDNDDDGDNASGGVDSQEKRNRKLKQNTAKLSKQKMAEIQRIIEADRRKLEEQKDMAVEERNRIQQHLEEKENELKQTKETRNNLMKRMEALQSRIIVGGENLLEKAEAQEKLLEQSAAELRKQQLRAEQLNQKLKEKEEERINIEEKYNNLQEEAAGKRRKLRKLSTMYLQAKSELEDLKNEHTREMEGLLDNIRQLSRELAHYTLIIDRFIPQPYQALIQQNVQWNEDIGEWQLKCVAYTGNNMRKPEKKAPEPPIDLSNVYLSYRTDESGISASRKSQKTKSRIKSANKKTGWQPVD
ncbi:unnamed protein product [Trichobilharzia szidati]|nr:unnamed protein product [Trichobilharzia szidati]